MATQRIAQPRQRKWSIRIDAAVTCCISLAGGPPPRAVAFEPPRPAPDLRGLNGGRHALPPCTSWRIPAIEIAGRKRTNMRNSQPKQPIEPIRIAQSQNVG